MNAPFPKRIMHVEDDSIVQEIIRAALTQGGEYLIMGCPNGKEALFKASAFAPDLILMDYYMPDMDGPEVLDALQKTKNLQSVPAIFMTGSEEEIDLNKFESSKVIGLIHKPFNPAQLSQEIKSIWKKAFTD